ncbi:hypothetical protein VTO73DRAFT_9914 [Trametes versicolor]
MFFHANSRLPGDSAYTPVRMYLLRLRLGHRMFSSVIGRLENRAEEMSSRPHNRYAELESSVARWHGWLDFLAHPTGQGVLPADTTPAERSALRRFVRALIYFSARHALGPRDPDLLAFLASLRSIWHADGFNVDSRMRIHALQWAREEGVAYTAWCATTSNIPPAHAAEASAGKLDYLFTELDEGYDSDSDSMPSLESLSGSESEY